MKAAIIAIIAVLVVGSLYFWNERGTQAELPTEETVESINTQDDSDDVTSIEADLQNTDVEGMDAELNAI